ncbi:MAG: globin, partial [Dyadobacter sp.]
MEGLSLYERIGGEETLRLLTDRFYDHVFGHEL